jgi:hypothetical protein
MQVIGALPISEVMVILAFQGSNQFDSHGHEFVFLSIHAIPEKAFEKLFILESIPCSKCFCIDAYLLNCSPICLLVDAYLLGRFPASIAFDNPLLGPTAENGGLTIGRVQ